MSIAQVENALISGLKMFIGLIVMFFLTAALLMVTYNNSIPEMSDQHKPINFMTAMWFTLFILVLSIYFKCNCGLSWRSLRQ